MTASVGDLTSSMTIANGSRTPVAISASRSAIRGSNLEKRSRSGATTGGSIGSASAVWAASVIVSGLKLHHGVYKLADCLDLGLHVHGDDDIEFVLDRGDEIHHRQAIPFEIALE